MPNPPPARRRRRWWRALATALIVGLGLVAAAPWLLSTDPARRLVMARINRVLAPGRVEFATLGLSWSGPTRLGGFVLLDPGGARVASGPSAVLDRRFGQLLFGGGGTATLTLDRASLEVERAPAGTINLAEALRSVIATPDPRRDLVVRVGGGTLRYRDPALAEPITADALDLTLRVPAAPSPLSWDLKLGRGGAGLEVHGEFDHHRSRGGGPGQPDLLVAVLGRDWPIVARLAGVEVGGRLDGGLDFDRKRGLWKLGGDARLLGFRAHGPGLAGDALAFDRVEAGWDLAEADGGWSIRRLGLTCPVGEIRAEGGLAGPDGLGRQRLHGRVDLASLARQLPHALRLRDGLTVERGSARLEVAALRESGRSTYDIEANLSDLAARDGDRSIGLRDPATFSARLVRAGADSRVERLAVKTSFLDASARGRLDQGVKLAATVDLGGLRRQLGEWLDLGRLDLAGRAEVEATYRAVADGFANSWKATVRDLRADGLGLGPIRRDSATLEASATGPVDASGWPTAWDRADLAARSGASEARLALEARPRSIGVEAAASSRPFGDDRAVTARLVGDWSPAGPLLSIAEARVGVASKSGGPVEAIARGRLDLAIGELILEPVATAAPGSIAPGPDGVRVAGIGRGLAALRVDGGLVGDLDALDRLFAEGPGRPGPSFEGRWSLIATARGDGDGVLASARFELDRPAAPGERGTSMAVRARYAPASDRVELAEFTVATPFGTLDASGRVDDPGGRRRLDLRGTIAPDFAAITADLARRVEPGARVDGRPRPFSASGTLGDGGSGGLPAGLDAEIGFDLVAADVYGMRFGPMPIVARVRGGKLAIDPIGTTLNEGHIRLEPEADLGALGGPILRLGKNSTIRDARINDEVSRRVLSFVAPILDQATRAGGRVSVDLDHAEFPIGPGRGRQVKVEGAVVFEDVEFGPGPLAVDLLATVGRRDLSLKLDRPVTLTIADGRVNQRGLAIPIGDLTAIELAGWVDFDRNLALTATLPVTPSMLGNNALLADIAAGTVVRVPITGSLDRPRVDREAFAANLQEAGRSLLTRGATRGALELFLRLGRPKDPDAPASPPRMTPEGRKARRQERREQRKANQAPPGP